MSYWETLLVIMRRWRISVPAMLVAAGVGTAAFFVSPPSYQDTVQVLFLGSPNQPGVKTKVNPYLGLSSTLVQTAAVVQSKLSTPQEVDNLAKSGATAVYGVAPDQSTPAPVLIVTATSANPATARLTSGAVVAEIEKVLVNLQQSAGAPTDTWVHSSVISSLPKPTRKLNASVRPAIVAAGGVFALTMFVLFLLEGRSRRRDSGERPVRSQAGAAAAGPHDAFGLPYSPEADFPAFAPSNGQTHAAPAPSHAPRPINYPQPQPHPYQQPQPQSLPARTTAQPAAHASQQQASRQQAPRQQGTQLPSYQQPAPQQPGHQQPGHQQPTAPQAPHPVARRMIQPVRTGYPAQTGPPTLQVPRLLPTNGAPHPPAAGQANGTNNGTKANGRLNGNSSQDAGDSAEHGSTNTEPANTGSKNSGSNNSRSNNSGANNGASKNTGSANTGSANTGSANTRPEGEGRTTWRR